MEEKADEVAQGNKQRKVTADLMAKFPETQTNKRGITIDGTPILSQLDCRLHLMLTRADHLRMKGAPGIFAIGDCTASSYAPTAQVASQEGAYLARVLAQTAKADAMKDKLETMKQEGKTLKEVDAVQRQLEKVERLRPFHYSHQGSLA